MLLDKYRVKDCKMEKKSMKCEFWKRASRLASSKPHGHWSLLHLQQGEGEQGQLQHGRSVVQNCIFLGQLRQSISKPHRGNRETRFIKGKG